MSGQTRGFGIRQAWGLQVLPLPLFMCDLRQVAQSLWCCFPNCPRELAYRWDGYNVYKMQGSAHRKAWIHILVLSLGVPILIQLMCVHLSFLSVSSGQNQCPSRTGIFASRSSFLVHVMTYIMLQIYFVQSGALPAVSPKVPPVQSVSPHVSVGNPQKQ